MEVVKGLDLKRYMGKWYEIASLPTRFQPRNSNNTTANYTLKDDGVTIEVLNETYTDGGKIKKAYIQGIAYKADPSNDEAKFKVKFYLPPFLPIIPVTEDYWVLYIDEDYQYVLVGEPTKSSLWILCREKQLDGAIYDELVKKARTVGYDVKQLGRTTQTDFPSGGGGGGGGFGFGFAFGFGFGFGFGFHEMKDKLWWLKSIFGK